MALFFNGGAYGKKNKRFFSVFSLYLRWQLVIMCVFHNEVIIMLLAHLVRTRFS